MTGLGDTNAAIAYGTGLLRGPRIHLRAHRDEDYAPLSRWWNDPATLPLQQATTRPLPETTMAERFRQWGANTAATETGFAVVRTDDDALIGQVGLKGAPGSRSAEFAIVLGPDYTSQGYGTEACRLMIDFGFGELGLHRIELRTQSYNSRALAAYRRAGFTEEGRRREIIFHNDGYSDEVIMSILEQEWRAGRA